jgi:hypothetical protein
MAASGGAGEIAKIGKIGNSARGKTRKSAETAMRKRQG